jgi:hypothetical protein
MTAFLLFRVNRGRAPPFRGNLPCHPTICDNFFAVSTRRGIIVATGRGERTTTSVGPACVMTGVNS